MIASPVLELQFDIQVLCIFELSEHTWHFCDVLLAARFQLSDSPLIEIGMEWPAHQGSDNTTTASLSSSVEYSLQLISIVINVIIEGGIEDRDEHRLFSFEIDKSFVRRSLEYDASVSLGTCLPLCFSPIWVIPRAGHRFYRCCRNQIEPDGPMRQNPAW